MTTVKLKLDLNLPDQIAQEAERAGLLTGQAIERLIEQAVRREAGKQLLDAMRRLHEANVPALTEEEIAAEVQEVRAVQRATREAGR